MSRVSVKWAVLCMFLVAVAAPGLAWAAKSRKKPHRGPRPAEAVEVVPDEPQTPTTPETPEKPEKSRHSWLTIDALWTQDSRPWGYRMATARQDVYELGAELEIKELVELEAEATLLGEKDRYQAADTSWSIGFEVPELPKWCAIGFGYEDTRFPNPSAGSARGFRGVERLREAHLGVDLAAFEFGLDRSLEGGDAGGTYASLGIGLPLGRFLFNASTNYNHHYFRKDSGITHHNFLLARPIYATKKKEGGGLAITPYVFYQLGQDKEFEDTLNWGINLVAVF